MSSREKDLANPVLKFPEELYNNAPGLVGDIAKWIMKASYRPRKEFAYACSLSAMSCLIGPYLKFGPKCSKVNLYITLVGFTGDGKNEAVDSMCLLLGATDAKDCIADFPASEAALRRQLNVSSSILIRVDEFAHKIASLLGKGNTNGTSMLKAILEAYNGARMPPKSYADTKKDLPAVENPFVQIIGMTTEKLWEVLQPEHIEDGTLNRFLFVCLPKDAGYVNNPALSVEVPKDLKDKLNAFWRQGRMNDLIGDVEGFGRHVEFSPEVQKALNALDKETYEEQRQLSQYAALYTRDVLYVSKVAAILAVGGGRQVVGMTDYQQAMMFVEWCRANTYDQVNRKLAGSEFERLSNKVIELLESAGGKMTMRELCRRLGMYRTDVDKLIDTTEFNGRIWLEEADSKRGRTSVVVHLGEQNPG